jgi:hypothetical protein
LRENINGIMYIRLAALTHTADVITHLLDGLPKDDEADSANSQKRWFCLVACSAGLEVSGLKEMKMPRCKGFCPNGPI